MSQDPYAKLRLAAWRDALRVLAIQALAMTLVGLMGWMAWDERVGLGALIGAAIGLFANVYSAIALLGKPLAQQQAGGVLVSWLVRVGLTVSLLIVAMRAKFVPPLSLIAGLGVVIIAHWIAVSFWLSGRR